MNTSNRNSVKNVMKKCKEKFGGLDILVNNLGINNQLILAKSQILNRIKS